jgi:hypothetical protein
MQLTVINITESDTSGWKVLAEQEVNMTSEMIHKDINKNRRKGRLVGH